jgi:cytochrome P450
VTTDDTQTTRPPGTDDPEPAIYQSKTKAGDQAWMVTSYAAIRALLPDARLGRSHPDPDKASRYSRAAISGRPRGDVNTERDDHTRMRQALAPAFSAVRMARLRRRIGDLTNGLLDDLDRSGPPADLHELVSSPLPSLVMCELLGVPFDDRADFRSWSEQSADMSDAGRAETGLRQLREYMRDLIARKRADLGEDVVSDLLRAVDGGGFAEEEIIGLSADLLFAGNETTVTAIDRGVLLLLGNPAQRDLMLSDPAALGSAAVEEVLRMFGVRDPGGAGGVPRYANTTFAFEGVTIERGDLVVLRTTFGNYDDAVYADPERFDMRRDAHPHLTFGHGPYFCLGASLARLELEIAFTRLFGRFPTLALAVPPERIRERVNLLTGGIAELPVTW